MTFFSNRTFGIEIECIRPVGMTYAELARRIAREASVGCHYESYDPNHRAPREWKVTTDASLPERGCEVVSPILSGEHGLAEVKAVMEVLRTVGCTVNRDTGLHVHVGFDSDDLRGLKYLAATYIRFESAFDAIMPVSRRATNNRYVKSNRKAAGGDYSACAAERAWQKIMRAQSAREVTRLVNPEPNWPGSTCRFYKLNLTVLDRQPTIEFRQHSGTVEWQKATNWIKLLIAFTEGALTSRQRAWSERDDRPELRFLLGHVCADQEAKAYFTNRVRTFRDQRRVAG